MLSGIGGHSGKDITMEVSPSDGGIWFVVPEGKILAHIDAVVSTHMCTTLKNDTAYVATVEHFLSACAALGIQDVNVTLSGNELPLMDGSAVMFYDYLDQYNMFVKSYKAPYVISKPFKVMNERGWIELTPNEDMIFDVTVDAPFPKQHAVFNCSKDDYKKDIAKARTFGFLEDGKKLREQGLALGASPDNTIALDADDKVCNPEGLRYDNELARHKILDAMGDLFLLGQPIRGYYKAVNPSHTLNINLAQLLRKELLPPKV